MEFKAERSGEKRILVQLEGALDRETVPDIRKKLLKIARKKDLEGLDVNFARVTSVDTAGIAILVELMKSMSRRGRTLGLMGLNDNAWRLIHLARLDEIFDMKVQVSEEN